MWEAVLSFAAISITLFFFRNLEFRNYSNEIIDAEKEIENALYNKITELPTFGYSQSSNKFGSFRLAKIFDGQALVSFNFPASVTHGEWATYMRDDSFILSKGLDDFHQIHDSCILDEIAAKDSSQLHFCHISKQPQVDMYKFFITGSMNVRIYNSDISLFKEYYKTLAHPVVRISVTIPESSLIIVSSHQLPRIFSKRIFYLLLQRAGGDPQLFVDTLLSFMDQKVLDEFGLMVIRTY